MASTAAKPPVCGNLPEVIRNSQKLYEGNLIAYFRIIFNFARNLRYPYHNFRHMLHVTWLCYKACQYYSDILSPREMRNLLIAALFHDFDHSGTMGDDDLNIARAMRGLEKHIQPEDVEELENIKALIKVTEYPPKVASSIWLCVRRSSGTPICRKRSASHGSSKSSSGLRRSGIKLRFRSCAFRSRS